MEPAESGVICGGTGGEGGHAFWVGERFVKRRRGWIGVRRSFGGHQLTQMVE